MNKQKRMIYVYEENVEFYDSLQNKSEFINDHLRLSAKVQRVNQPTDDPNWHPDPRIRATRASIDALDKKRKENEALSHNPVER